MSAGDKALDAGAIPPGLVMRAVASDGPESHSAEDRLDACLSQLCASLEMINGEGFDNFSRCNETIQSNYIWMVCEMAKRAKSAKELMDIARYPDHETSGAA